MYEMALYEKYPPLHKIFSLVQREADTAFLDSSLQNTLGRYSIIGRKPYLKLVCGHNFTVNGIPCDTPFPEYVKAYLQTHREKNPFPELPLLSGAIGYFSYDYGRGSAGVATRHKKDSAIPEAVLVFYDQFLIEDREKQCLYLISHDHGQSCTAGLMELKALVHEAEQTAMEQSVKGEAAVEADFTQEEYLDAVERVISYIVDGDIYIANLTQQLQLQSRAAPYDVYCCLRENNPSPFGGYLQYGDFQVLSMSPERFLTMRDRVVETRPIKGTRKRGMTREEDDALRRELADSEKDKSELLMIVDLERNDLHRVCVPGSVTVQELFSVEAYATVFHLVADVTGTLEPTLDVMDLLDATFPGGSITGAPKRRAMEIIDELEHSPRGLYTGAMGYLSLSGDCDFNIIIRTLVHQNGTYTLGVGGGITCESDPLFEYDETLQKAKAPLKALNGSFGEERSAEHGDHLR